MPTPAMADKPIGAEDQPFDWRVVEGEFAGGARYCFEVRPTRGAWKPFLLGVPRAEQAKVVALLPGPAGAAPPANALVGNPAAGPTPDGSMYCWRMDNAATAAQSYFLLLAEMPSAIVFGQESGFPQYRLAFREIAAIDDGDDGDDDDGNDGNLGEGGGLAGRDD